MTYLFLVLSSAIISFNTFADAAPERGYLMIELQKVAYQKPGYDEVTPPIEIKNEDTSVLFALPLDQQTLDQILPHGPQEPGGVKLGLAMDYAQDADPPAHSFRFTWWFAVDDQGFIHAHGWANGFETIVGHVIHAATPTTTIQVRLPRWEDISFGSYMSYVRDMSGANVGVKFWHVGADDPAVTKATLLRVGTRSARSPEASVCEPMLGTVKARTFIQ